ncbi:MAG: MaoC family dehydratase N-terminal domain-containing protein [Tagaea sp.]
MTDYSAWIGRTETREERVDPAQALKMAATLDRPAPRAGDPLPPGWHWMFFNAAEPRAALGPDGHPKRGGFLPPVELPRRMWAGGRLTFHGPLRGGAHAIRHSEILKVESKSGKSGDLVFVTVKHRIEADGALALEEEHDIVYRDAPLPGAAQPSRVNPPSGGEISRTIVPDPTLLFRYSALTFNGHRIHYDQPYATKVEGYPGLVFHGPLTATLLMGLCEELGGQPLARFSFRGAAPLFDTAPFAIRAKREGSSISAWAETPDGALAMDGKSYLQL